MNKALKVYPKCFFVKDELGRGIFYEFVSWAAAVDGDAVQRSYFIDDKGCSLLDFLDSNRTTERM